MGRRTKKNRGGQQNVKGFRPGKAPAHLQRQDAMRQLPKDAPAAQQRMMELIAGRTPDEVRSMVNRWVLILAIVGVVLLVSGVFLYRWSIFAGLVAFVLAGVIAFLAARVHGQRDALIQAAKTLGGGRRG